MALHTVRGQPSSSASYSTLKRWVHTGHVRTTRTEGGHHRISGCAGYGDRTFELEIEPGSSVPRVHMIRASEPDSSFHDRDYGGRFTRIVGGVSQAGFPVSCISPRAMLHGPMM